MIPDPICPIEAIFREVAMMRPPEPKDEDPFDSEEYHRFVEAMAVHCRCEPISARPCDGVLAGGLCDCAGSRGFDLDRRPDWEEYE